MVREVAAPLRPALAGRTTKRPLRKATGRNIGHRVREVAKKPNAGGAQRSSGPAQEYAVRQVRSAALMFFSAVACERKLLPRRSFNDVLLRAGKVVALRNPPPRFVRATYSMLWAWLHCEVPAFAALGRPLTATLAVECGGVPLEAFQFAVRAPPASWAPPGDFHYERDLKNVVYKVQAYRGALEALPDGAQIVLDVAEGEVHFCDGVDEDADLFDDDISFVNDVPPCYLALTEKTGLGSIRCEKALIECAHFTGPDRF